MDEHCLDSSAAPLRDEQIVTGDGLRLAASVAGERGQPGAVLLHGAGQTRHSWRGTVATLGALGYHALAYDARGHGESGWSPQSDYSFERLADDLDAVVGHLGGVPAFVGASMGGMTALHSIGRSQAEYARSIVLVDIAPRVEQKGVKRVHDFLNGHRNGFASIEEASDAVAAYNPHRPRPSNPQGLMKKPAPPRGRTTLLALGSDLLRTTRQVRAGAPCSRSTPDVPERDDPRHARGRCAKRCRGTRGN